MREHISWLNLLEIFLIWVSVSGAVHSTYFITSHISFLLETFSSSYSSSPWTLNETTDFFFPSSISHSSPSLPSLWGLYFVFCEDLITHTCSVVDSSFSVFNCFVGFSVYSSNLLSLYISIFLRWKIMLGEGSRGHFLCPFMSHGKTKSPSLFCVHYVFRCFCLSQ